MTYSPQKIHPGGGRKNPRSCERKSAGADKLIKYLEQARRGIQRVDNRELQRLEDQNKFAMMDAKERRQLLFNKLKSLQEEKEAMIELDSDSESERWRKARRRELKEGVINMEIMETLQNIDELEDVTNASKVLDFKRRV